MDTPEVNSVKTFGGGLFRALFVPELKACFQQSIAAAEMAEKGLRIRLRLTQAPEVADLPWEYLYYSQLNKFLALSSETPVVRYLDLPEHTAGPPLRFL